jgi:hypothetical protein
VRRSLQITDALAQPVIGDEPERTSIVTKPAATPREGSRRRQVDPGRRGSRIRSHAKKAAELLD